MTDQVVKLPGLDCGSCGYRTCEAFAAVAGQNPDMLKRCIHLSGPSVSIQRTQPVENGCAGCMGCMPADSGAVTWKDSLGRDFDFVLDLLPHDPGPRETIRLHNPQLVKELDVQVGDILIGRPLGMSCGCPVTHCGVAVGVDRKTGIIVWCVTGPLNPRQKGFKDLGYYSAEAYEGIVRESRAEIKVGMRYWFMPHKCMLQWRHSGLINFVNKTPMGLKIRLEGLLIG
jgi:uncharacterized Fe-S cluster-containing protein